MASANPVPSPAIAPRDSRVAPWYRQAWPWLLISGPAIVVVAGLVTAYIAWSTDDGVVAEDYYRRGLLINKSLERDARAAAWQLGATVRIDGEGSVAVDLAGPGVRDAPGAVTLRVTHATRAGMDRVVVLPRGPEGVYRGRIEAPPVGRWLVSVETDQWRLAAPEISGRPEELRLGSARDGR
jgi:hypothetical protein